MVDLQHDLHLLLGVIDLSLPQQHVFAEGLDGAQFLRGLVLSEEHFAVSTAANDHLEVERTQIYLAAVCRFLIIVDCHFFLGCTFSLLDLVEHIQPSLLGWQILNDGVWPIYGVVILLCGIVGRLLLLQFLGSSLLELLNLVLNIFNP